MRSAVGVIKICDGSRRCGGRRATGGPGPNSMALPEAPCSRRRSGLPGCPGSARPPWFGPAALVRPGRPGSARPPALLPLLALLPAQPSTGRRPACQRRSWTGAACREQQLTIPSATPTHPGSPAARPVAPPGRPTAAARPAMAILHRCCLPRTATHHPQRHPDPPGSPAARPIAPPGPPWRSCRGAACREQQLTNPGATPTPPGETQGKYPDNNHGRRPDNGHHAQHLGTPPNIRKPTH